MLENIFHEINKEKIMRFSKKKSVLATAIGILSGSAAAATWVTDMDTLAVIHTKEGVDKYTEAAGVAASNAIVKLNSVYTQNDTIKFTYNHKKATDYNWPTSLASIKSGTALATLNVVASEATAATSIQLETTGNTASVTGLVVGDVCTFAIISGSYRVKAVGSAGGGITVTPGLSAATAAQELMTCQQLKFVELGLINSDDTSVTYRVTNVNATGTSTVGAEIPAPAPTLSPDALETAAATIAFSAATANGTAMDALADTIQIASAPAEFTPAVSTKWNAVIDVEADKKSFSANSDTTTTEDDMVLGITTIVGTAGNSTTTNAAGVVDLTNAVAKITTSANSLVFTIDGDFTWMDDATTAGITADANAIICTGATDAVNTAGTQITITDTATMVATYTCTLKNTEAAALPVQSYSGSSTITYTSNAVATPTKTTAHADMGAWTLNGAEINVYGVPFGSTTSRFITVGNKGAGSAVVSGTVQLGGTSYGPYELATVASKESKAVGPALDTALANAGVTFADSSRGMVTLSSPVKANDITISAAYKAISDSDRLALESSDSLGTLADGK
jgi:hypothetical protein